MTKPFTITQNLRRSTNWRIIFGLLSLLTFSATAQEVDWEIFQPKLADFPTLSATTQTPSQKITLTTLNAPQTNPNLDNYQSRIRGYFNITVAGQYQFAMASDDGAQFWLSTDAKMENKTIAVDNPAYTGSNNTNTTTALRTLNVGIYYFEVLHDEGGGGDFVHVQWSKPGDAGAFSDIPSGNLLKFGINKAPTIDAIVSPAPVNIGAGMQTINLTGISDGDPAQQDVTITATSSNTSVVSSVTVTPSTITTQTTATLQYNVGSQHGITEITVTLKDNGGTLQNGDVDTYVTKFLVEVRDPNLNDAPSFGLPANASLNIGHGIEYVMLPNVDDGDGNTQNINFTFVNNTPAVLDVLGVDYTAGNKVAILKVRAKTVGNASITVTAKDDGGTANGGFDTFGRDISLSTKVYNNPGINTAYYDYAFWAASLPEDAVPHPGSVKIVSSANEPFAYLTQGQLWRKMWGYITPTVTGGYSFKTVGDWSSSYFFLSTDANPANIKQVAFETGNSPTPSDPAINLVAGNTYYWEATYTSYDAHAWSLYVAPPDEGYVYLDGSLSSPIFDTVAPTAVKNLRKITTGVNDLYVQWDASTDNAFLGYYVYVNGVKQPDTVRSTSYLVKNLQPNTSYSIAVRAYDLYENGSLPSNILTLKTYPVDNTAPTVPTGVTLVKAYDLGLQLSWTASTDAETEIRGYNVYYEGSNTPINKEIIKDPSYLITDLATKTSYKIQVEAVDAGYNKSAKSAVATFATTDFNPTSIIPGFKKGRLQFNMKPIATSNGIGLNGDYGPGSVLMRNAISNPGFEAADKNTGHAPSGNAVYSLTTVATSPADVYAGGKSAKFSGGANENLVSPITLRVTGTKKYTLRFAMKRTTTSKGDVKVNLFSRFGSNLFEKTITPTDAWQMYEYEVLPTSWTSIDEVSFSIQFTMVATGTFFIDELQFFEEGDDYMVNGQLSQYSKYGMGLLNEFKPSGLRWGGLGANQDNFNDHVGYHQNTFTYAEWIQMASLVGAKAAIVCGVNTTTEWFKDSTNFTKFADYIAGDASTPYGKMRIDAGIADLMSTSPGVLLELGNEVWGGTAHGAPTWDGNPTAYGIWARGRSSALKLSSGYKAHKDKIWTAYSGGSTDISSFGGWSRKAYLGDAGEVDWLSIMGYMGGNLGFAPEIPRGKSLLDYHKNTVSLLPGYWSGLLGIQKDMLKSIGMIKPMYMYEGNMTTGDFHGHLGQAINFTDYYAGNLERGVISPMIFQLGEGGEWGLLETVTRKKLPLFYTGALFNSYCKGTVVTTNFISGDSVVDGSGQKVNIEPVSAHTYVNGDTYTILLLSRDFENNFRVQLELPDSIKTTKGYKMYTITGSSLEATDVVRDSVINATTSLDSMLVTVAPYSMTVITFKANSYVLKAPAEGVLVNNKKVTTLDVTSNTGNFHLPSAGQTMVLTAKVGPEDAFDPTTSVSVLSTGNTAKGTTVTKNADGTYLVTAGSTPGNVTLRFKANDGSGVTKDVTISVITAIQTKVASYSVEVSPNPTSDIVNIDLPVEANQSTLRLYTLTGSLVTEKSVSPGLQKLDLSKLSQGMYILQIVDAEGNVTRKRIERL